MMKIMHAHGTRMKRLATAFLALAAVMAHAADYYVDVSWTGAESGTTNAPYKTIKAAVDAANAVAATHNIYIAAGWYGDVANGGTEDYSAGGGVGGGIANTRRINYYGGYVGWDGDGADPEDFDWTENSRVPRATAIDLKDAGSRAFYNSYGTHVLTGPLFDGLTFSNALHATQGGCIETTGNYGTTFFINNCLFANNTVTGSARGGAVSLRSSYSPSYIRNSDFIGNTAAGFGGAVYWIPGNSGSDITDCTFSDNQGSEGGGLCVDGGGGVILRTLFNDNTATSYGGGLYSNNGTVTIRRSTFARNAAPAGAAMGRGADTSWGGAYFLENCLIYGNTGGYAVQAEGVRYNSYSVDMLHCTVVGNTGGGVRFQHAGSGTIPGRLRNNIIAFNGGYGIYRVDDPYILSNNNLYGNTNAYFNCEPDAASISLDPAFIDADGDDYRLAITSPSIDAGSSDTGLLTDFDAMPRPTRNGWDQGCYEEVEACRIRNLAPVTTSTNAVLRGQLDYDGGMDAHVSIYWGIDDGGTDRAVWANTNVIGLLTSSATFDATLTLTPGETYWFRCYASNAYDEVWADASWSFTAEDVHLWTGLAGDGLASTAGNWFDNFLPTANGTVKLDSYTANMTWDAAAPHRVLRWEQTDQYSGIVTIATGWSNEFDRLMIDTDMMIAGGTLTHLQNTTGGVPYYRLKLDVGGDLTLASGTAIDVSGRGYLRGTGPGSGTVNLQGGTHGGEGYANTKPCYGSVWEPVDLGSGGGGAQGRAGGGAAYLTVGGTATISGVISADGQASTGNNNYGGAGGSVYLRCDTLLGNGVIRADGSGSGHEGSGGAGGRVAVIVTGGAAFGEVALTAYGFGANVHDGRIGAAGTVYKQSTAHAPTQGILIIDNSNRAAKRARTVIPSEHPLEDFEEIVIRNQGVFGFEPGDAFDFGAMANITPQSAAGAFITVRDLTGITFPEPFTISGYALRLDTPVTAAADWTVAADGVLSHSPYDESGESKLDLTLGGDLTVDGTIDVQRGGYFGIAGPGFTSGQGGSYGGLGFGAASGKCYGSILDPAHLGSGASTLGGGHARLVIAGNTAINGSVLAGCLAADTRNGSGGTVNLRTGTLSGSGEVNATGGHVTNPSWSESGGGGGRIAVRLDTGNTLGDVVFIVAGGGGGQGSSFNSDGGAGTLYLQRADQAEGAGTIIVNNANHNNPKPTEFPPTQAYADDLSRATLQIEEGSWVSLTRNVTIGNLFMASNTTFTLNGYTCKVNSLQHSIAGTPTGPGEVKWQRGTLILLR